jgi:ArsR family transcriptional regulator, lead/cadmium/zinc/bismuth-responsive transcriptional repressor
MQLDPTTQKMIDETSALDLAELFRALADPTRVKILYILLQGEQTTTALASMVGITDAAISHQLRGLKQMHIVRPRRQGREVYYSLDDEHVTDLLVRGWEHIQHA